MALTLSVAPNSKVNFVNNPLEVKCNTDSYITTAGIKWTNYIDFTVAPTTAGLHFTVDYKGDTIDLLSTTAGGMVYDGLHYRAKSGLETLHQWVVAYASNLAGNYTLGSNFDIVADAVLNRVVFTAKVTGLDEALTFSAIAGTYTLGTETPGVDEEVLENFKVLMQVHARNGDGDYEIIKSEMENIDNENFRLSLNAILQGYVGRDLPIINSGGMMLSAAQTCAFFLIYYEASGDPLTPKYLFTTNTYYAWLAGLSEFTFPGNSFSDDYEAPAFKFLTWQPRKKYVTTGQNEWLAFLHKVGNTYLDVEVKLEIFYVDGTNETQYVISEALTPDETNVWNFETGYEQLVDPGAAGPVSWYRVTLVEKTVHTVLSESFSYYIVDELPVYTRYFLFANSLGWWDTLRSTGERTGSVKIEMDVLKKYLPMDYDLSDGRYVMSQKPGQKMFKQNVGFLKGEYTDTAALLAYMAELIISPQVFEIINDDLIPVIITSKEIATNADNQDLYSFEFEYYQAYDYIGEQINVPTNG